MIIELYGLSGAGKTTLSKEIAKNTNFRVVKIKNKFELLYFNFWYFIKHPIKFFVTLFYILKNSPNRKFLYRKFMNPFLHHNARYQKALRSKFSIIDQGYFQNIISVFEKKISPKFLKRYIKFLLLPDQLIVFDVSKKNRLAMMSKRGYFARDEFDADYRKKWEKIIEHNDRILKEGLKNKNISIDYRMIKDADINNFFKQIIRKIKQDYLKNYYG